MARKDLVLFSPLRPARNGIADYVDSFISELAEIYNLFVVIANSASAAIDCPAEVLRATEYVYHEADFSHAPHLYQVGNNSDHIYMLPIIEQRPGLVTVHDLSVLYLMDMALSRSGDGDAALRLALECNGAHGLTLVRESRVRQAGNGIEHVEMGRLPALIARSAGVVVHSLLGRIRVNPYCGTRPVFQIPHAYDRRAIPMMDSRKRARVTARQKLGLPMHRFIIVSAGFVTRAKRVDLAVLALRQLRQLGHDCLLVVAGEVRPYEYDLAADIRLHHLEDVVIVKDYVHEEDFMSYLAAADILMNLRDPTTGETSGTLTNGLAVGCCTLVSDVGTYAEFPDSVVVKIPSAAMTADGILDRLVTLVADPELREYFERNAVDFARRELSPKRFIERYVDAIEQTFEVVRGTRHGFAVCDRSLMFLPAQRRRQLARSSTDSRATLWYEELLMPVREEGQRLLVVEDNQALRAAAEEAFGWAGAVASWPDAWDPFAGPEAPDTSDDEILFDVALATGTMASYRPELMNRLIALARSLKSGGTLVLNLILSEHDDAVGGPCSVAYAGSKEHFHLRSYGARALLTYALENAGFEILRISDRQTEARYELDDFGDDTMQIAVLAVQRSRVFCRYPIGLFERY